MQYEEIDSISRSDAMVALGSADPRDICKALVRLAFHDPDLRWVQSLCIELTGHSIVEVQSTAILCLERVIKFKPVLQQRSLTSEWRRPDNANRPMFEAIAHSRVLIPAGALWQELFSGVGV
jgi:hypothetical protein